MSVLALKNTLWCDSSPKEWLCSVNPWWQTCENCHGRLRDAAPFKSLACQARSYRWVSALGFLVHTFVVQGREPGPVMGLGLHKWVTLNLCVSPLRHQGQLGSSFPLTAAWTSIWQDKAQTSFLKTSIWSSWGHDPGWVSQCAVFKKHYGIQNEIIFLLIIMAVNWSASRPEPTVCNWIFNLFCVV